MTAHEIDSFSRLADQVAERNLLSLRRHRPVLFERVVQAPETGRFAFMRTDWGEATLGIYLGGRLEPMMPRLAGEAHLRAVAAQWSAAHACIGVAGMGDGSVVSLMSQLDANEPTGRRQAVIVVEPELEVLRRCLHLHDWSGAESPLAAHRFHFACGEDWEAQLLNVMLSWPCPGFPSKIINGGVLRPSIAQGLERVHRALVEECRRRSREVADAYEATSAHALAARFWGDSSRPGRVLFVCPGFTTVLKHTARHLEDAFSELGWRTHRLTEGAAHGSFTQWGLLRSVTEFRPDLVVGFDRLRNNLFTALSPEVPFLSWIQDDFPLVASVSAGRSVRERDFVWVPWVDQYERVHEYPKRQLITSRALTTARELPERWPDPEVDLIYFSHASLSVDELRQSALERAHAEGLSVPIMERLVSALVQTYERGQSLRDGFDFVVQVAPELADSNPCGYEVREGRVVREFRGGGVPAYWSALAVLQGRLHRYQGLSWVTRLAERFDLRLAIHGIGWEKMPEYRRYARGVADYRTELVPLMQRARAALHLEPWPVVSHWRGLDTMAAGVPLLARSVDSDAGLYSLLQALDRSGASHAVDTPTAVAAALPETRRALLEAVYQAQMMSLPVSDPVRHLAVLRATSHDPLDYTAPRELRHVSFRDPAELNERLSALLSQPQEARQRALRMREETLQHYSYAGAVQRLTKCIAIKLGDEAARSSVRSPAARAAPPQSGVPQAARLGEGEAPRRVG